MEREGKQYRGRKRGEGGYKDRTKGAQKKRSKETWNGLRAGGRSDRKLLAGRETSHTDIFWDLIK